MSHEQKRFEYQVCYGVADRITFANGTWLGADIPESKRKQEDIQTCPLMWEHLNSAGIEGWELLTVLETPSGRGGAVRTYFLQRRIRD
jgi:hypothetical protein